MINLNKLLLTTLFCLTAAGVSFAQNSPGQVDVKTLTFRFVPGDDMFYIPWGGNGEQFAALSILIDEYRQEIAAGRMPVYVDGYCASQPSAKENINTAFVRANRVKSALITDKGLAEKEFITKNYATVYNAPDGKTYRDMVVVTLRIPVKEEPKPPVREEPRPESEPEPEPRPAPKETPAVVEEVEKIVEVIEPVVPSKPYCFAVRTNLLYDAFLLPTLGVEWRINRHVGIKVDGSRSWWGGEHGKVQKIWLVNPEVRWYMLDTKRFYVGATANFGEYNIYKGMLGSLFSDDTGYQGKLWNAGLTVGYQLCLSRSFSLDFNLGLGYTRFDYDSFRVIDGTRVYKVRDKSKKFCGPTQAGIGLIWTVGGHK